MKNVKVFNKQSQLISDQNLYDDPTEFVNHIVSTNYFGKPIRWVRAKVAVPPDHDGGTGYYVYPDEQYDDADAVATEERPTGKPVFDVNGDPILENGVPQREAETWVQLKAEYTIEIEDYNPVPQSISPAQARLALIQAGLYETVLDTVSVATDDVKVYWEYANTFERTNPILNSMASAIGITDEQLDELFRYGARL